MTKIMLTILCSVIFIVSSVAAEPLAVGSDDTIQSILSAHKGKRVTVKLKSGSELTGKVGEVNDKIVHLMELSGKEFFDAVASLRKIEAVIIRTRQ